MKDYYKNNENFILGYKIKKDNIIVKFSDGKELKLNQNEKEKIDSIMKKQVEDLSDKDLEKEENKVFKLFVFFTTCVILGLFVTLAFSFKNIIYCYISGFFSFVSGTLSLKNLSKLSKIDDTMKNVEYVKNEEKLNTEIENANLLNNCPRKAKEIVTKSKNKKFDINSIDKLSYKELKELLEIIEKINYLTSSEKTQEEVDKDKQLCIKKPN